MAVLPYITAPGNIDRALNGIKAAATPPAVSQDFVKTILLIKGGSGNQITAYLKKIGFAGPDGAPTSIYKRFRNPDTAGAAAAEALKIGYAPLYARNEYMHSLSDDKLRGLIIEETGSADDSTTVTLVLSCIKAVKKHASWHATTDAELLEIKPRQAALGTGDGQPATPPPTKPPLLEQDLGLNLAYTINLNLPATSDIAVFNAIFKSLKENLLRNGNG